MKKKKILLGLIVLVVGYLLGCLINYPNLTSNNLSGSVGKVNRFKKSVVSENSQVMIEKLKTDSAFCRQALTSLSIFSARAGKFQANAELSLNAATELATLQDACALMQDLHSIAENAALNNALALLSVQAALNGEMVEVEQAINNAMLSYMKFANNEDAIYEWLVETNHFLADKNLADYPELAYSCDLWVDYQIFESILAGDQVAFEYWSQSDNFLSQEESKAVFNNLSTSQQNAIALGSYIETAYIKSLGHPETIVDKGYQLNDTILQMAIGTTAIQMTEIINNPPNNGTFANTSSIIHDIEQLNVIVNGNQQLFNQLSNTNIHKNLQILNLKLNQEQLNLKKNQEQLNLKKNQEQLNIKKNQEQLNLHKNQEQLNLHKNQEQLNLKKNQEQLNLKKNQEQLNLHK